MGYATFCMFCCTNVSNIPHDIQVKSGRNRFLSGNSRNVTKVGLAFDSRKNCSTTMSPVTAMQHQTIVGNRNVSAMAMPDAKAMQTGSIGLFIGCRKNMGQTKSSAPIESVYF